MQPHERIVFALDTSDPLRALNMVRLLRDHVGYFKVGLELFIGTWGREASLSFSASNARAVSAGEQLLEAIPCGKLILDLKLHDIPETVERAVRAAARYKPAFITIHVQQRETLERAQRCAEKEGVKLLAVTVLTSMSGKDCQDLHYNVANAEVRALKMAYLAWECGIGGFVCSPQEAKRLKQMHRPDREGRHAYPVPFLMVPGIRPAPPIEVGRAYQVGEHTLVPLRVTDREVFFRDGDREVATNISSFQKWLADGWVTYKVSTSPVYCEHANENPALCPCLPECHCRQRGNTCAQRTTGMFVRHDVPGDPLVGWQNYNPPKRAYHDEHGNVVMTEEKVDVKFERAVPLAVSAAVQQGREMTDDELFAKLEEAPLNPRGPTGFPKVDAALGFSHDDQKRTGTPAQAIRDGADLLVVGRPIRDASDPVAAAKAIAKEIEAANAH